MDSIFGFQSTIVVVRLLFPKSFLYVIEASFFLCYAAEYAVIVFKIATEIQTYQQLRQSGCQQWDKVLVPVCYQAAGMK